MSLQGHDPRSHRANAAGWSTMSATPKPREAAARKAKRRID